MRYIVPFALSAFIFLLASCTVSSEKNNTYNPPNIIIITAEGLGFSDLGHFGSEINTPNLDKLAEEGLVISEFYNAGGFCQTAASLLTGLYPGQTGFSCTSDIAGDKMHRVNQHPVHHTSRNSQNCRIYHPGGRELGFWQ